MKIGGEKWNRTGSHLKRGLGRNAVPGLCSWGQPMSLIFNLYKHGIVRMYLNLGDDGQCYVARRNWRFERADFGAELEKLEASLAELVETLESAYDETYIARKRKALEMMGIPLQRIEIKPEDLSIN